MASAGKGGRLAGVLCGSGSRRMGADKAGLPELANARPGSGRPATLFPLVAALLMLCADARADAVPDWQQAEWRRRLIEHPLFKLPWNASHRDSLAALQYDTYIPAGSVFQEVPACLALVRIVAIAPIDSALVTRHVGISSLLREHLLGSGSTLSIEVLGVFGCRLKQTALGLLQVSTAAATSYRDYRIHGGRGERNQVLYPGAEAFVLLTQAPTWDGLEMLVSLLCLGEPDHRAPRELGEAELADPLFGLRYRVTPLFREFGRALAASDPDPVETQSESSMPSGQ